MNLMDFKLPVARPRPLTLGIDISPQSLKYLLLSQKARSLKVEAFGRYSLESTHQEPFEVLQQVIGWLFQKHHELKKAKVVIGLSGGQVVLKAESLPQLTRKELLQTIYFGLQREMGAEQEEAAYVYDYKSLGPDPLQEGNFQYLTMGAPQELVEDQIRCLTNEGLIPDKATPTMAAIGNLISYIPEISHQESIGILDIGAQKSTLVFMKNGQLDFFREIVVGGEDFTKGITGTVFHEGRAIQFKTEEAVEFKMKYGYPLGFSEGMTFLGAPLSEVGMMMRPVVERLTGEIQRSIGFYKESSGGSDIEALYLIGGGARLKHLPEVLTEKTDIPVSNLPVLQGMKIGGNEKQQHAFKKKYLELGISLALALDSSDEGNLLPATLKRMNKAAPLQKGLYYVAAGVLMLLIIFTLFYRGQVEGKKSRVQVMRTIVARSRNSGPIFAALQKEKTKLDGRIASVSGIMDQDDKPIQILRLISHAVPENLSLINLQLGKEEEQKRGGRANTADTPTRTIVRLRGVSHKPGNDIRIYLAKLIVEMEKSGYFSDVQFQRDTFSPEEDEYGFEVIGYLKQEGNTSGQ